MENRHQIVTVLRDIQHSVKILEPMVDIVQARDGARKMKKQRDSGQSTKKKKETLVYRKRIGDPL